MNKLELLQTLNFGERVAEQDENLVNYFVETNIWRQLKQDKIDIIYGAKGSGKSALYRYLLTKKDSLLDSNILLISAENIKGTPVFKQVLSNKKLDESTFKHLWFLYILTLLGSRIKELPNQTHESRAFISKLEDEKLLCPGTLKSILTSVRTYIEKHFFNTDSIEHSLSFDESGMPIFSRKISFSEPSPELRKLGCISVYDLLDMANNTLESLNYDSWITFDRLDVAFADNPDLEAVALRSLFDVYNDMQSASHIKLKIFIRDDIWKRITKDGLREGSHIIKQTTITWNEQDFLFLVVSRIVDNESLCNYFNVDKDTILADKEKQNDIFYSIFPRQVKSGNNPKTFNWMLSRVEDGLGISAPRELIHLLNESKEQQIQLLETGTKEDSYDELISRAALIQALRVVSKVRLEQTIYQEYSDLKQYIELLEEEKTEQDIKSLSKIFKQNITNTKIIANKLVNIGFFKEKEKTNLYWVPFIYRDALKMSQGRKKRR